MGRSGWFAYVLWTGGGAPKASLHQGLVTRTSAVHMCHIPDPALGLASTQGGGMSAELTRVLHGLRHVLCAPAGTSAAGSTSR